MLDVPEFFAKNQENMITLTFSEYLISLLPMICCTVTAFL